eukprot:1145437-Pelagomonas_calceolata.AAC.2
MMHGASRKVNQPRSTGGHSRGTLIDRCASVLHLPLKQHVGSDGGAALYLSTCTYHCEVPAHEPPRCSPACGGHGAHPGNHPNLFLLHQALTQVRGHVDAEEPRPENEQ